MKQKVFIAVSKAVFLFLFMFFFLADGNAKT